MSRDRGKCECDHVVNKPLKKRRKNFLFKEFKLNKNRDLAKIM
jgi:hypothetical protein